MFVTAALIAISATLGVQQHVYVASGDHLFVYRVDAETGRLDTVQKLPLFKAGPFALSPDRTRLYAMASTDAPDARPAIATLRRDKDGRLALLHLAPCGLRAGYLSVDATNACLAGNHYGPGKATVWNLDDAGVYRGETATVLDLEKRAHCAVFSPDNRWLLVCATGPNKVFVNRFDPRTGDTRPNDPPFAKGPTGESDARQPRHIVFHPKLRRAYTTNEREHPGVAAWDWNPDNGTLVTTQNIVTQPDDFTGRMTTADLHLTPDGRFLYVSNRDLTVRKSPTGNDSIAALRVDPATGALTLIGHYPCERIPRSFTIDATGRYLYVAGQSDGRVGAYRIDQQTGALTRIARYDVGGAPIWVEAVPAPN